MRLSPTQLRIAQDWIDQYVGRHCPCCGYTSLHLDDRLMALVEAPEKDGELDSETVDPMVTLRCGVCANVRMFSAKMVGVIGEQHAQCAGAKR